MPASDQLNYRGISYVITNIGECKWSWKILPPNGVKGLRDEGGSIMGKRDEAIAAAQQAIERQTG